MSAGAVEASYFFAHLFEALSHMPPAFSQSACVVYWVKSPEVELELGDGLADGEEPAPLGPPDAGLPDAPPAPVAPEPPDGAPEPEPAAPLPLPEPLV